MFGAPVAQDGDERLFVGAKLLLSCLEEGLQPQRNLYTSHTVMKAIKTILQSILLNWFTHHWNRYEACKKFSDLLKI